MTSASATLSRSRFSPGPLLRRAAEHHRLILALAFLVQALGVVLFFAVEVPFGRPPDEPAHVSRGQTVRYGQVLGRRASFEREGKPPEITSGGRVHLAIMVVSFLAREEGEIMRKVTEDVIAFNRGITWETYRDRRRYINLSNTVQYPPTLYVPLGLTLYAGEKLGASPYQTLLMGRVVNAALYVALGVTAIALAQAGAIVIFLVLSLPMSLFLGGSMNQDGLMIACAALAAAFSSRLALAREVDRKALIGLTLACLAFIGARPVYITLLPLLFWPDFRFDWAAFKRTLSGRLAGFTTVFIAIAAWSWTVARYVQVPYEKRELPYETGPLWPVRELRYTTDPAAQLEILSNDPLLIFGLIAKALDPGWINLLREAVGVLGTLDIILPTWMYMLFYWTFAAAVLGDALQRKPVTVLHSLAYVAVCLVGLFLIYFLQFVTWTDVGMDYVDGVQGRYLLPMLIFAGLFAPSLMIARIETAQTALRGAIVLAVAAVPIVNTIYLPRLIVERYYLQ